MDLQAVLTTTMHIARQAGDLVRHGFGQTKQIERKYAAADWVTQYDKAAEELILSQLRTNFPDHQIIGEESGHNGSQSGLLSPYTWHVDPLDGTHNFAHGFPHFSVSMALYENNQPRIGVVHDPMRDECFAAIHGGGAFLYRNGDPCPLFPSQTETLIDSLLTTGFPFDRHNNDADNVAQFRAMLKRTLGVRRTGSAALDLAYVAAGRFDGYWEMTIKSYDIGAGVIIVQEAGGEVTLFDGRPFELDDRVSLIASNGRIHPPMLAVLTEASMQPG